MEALEIRIKLGDKNELPKSYINIANYYRGEKKYSEARQAADQALLLGKEIGSLFTQRDAYQAILLIEKERENFKESLEASENFKRLSDSIQSQLAGGELERLKLQYDFEKAEQANQLEKSQIRTRFTIAVIVLAAGLLISVLLVVVIRSRVRQSELKQKNLSQDVEIKNKELTTNIIYLVRKNELINDVAERLLEIKQAVPTDHQRAIQNIVLELQRETDNDTWKEFEVRFNQVHGDFYEKLRQQYPDLSPSDEKLCAFLRLNMSTKEIAAITKQNVKSLEVARARLRKKLNLTNTSSSLVTHLANL
jgi:DNA-binding CsgD family transcriptional regulator